MEIKWGLVPDMGGMVLMRDLVRTDVVRELTFTGRIFSGEEAVALGFATRVSADPLAEALADGARDRAQEPGRDPRRQAAAEPAASWTPRPLLLAESVEQKALIGSPNQTEAALAGLEKREPRFAD